MKNNECFCLWNPKLFSSHFNSNSLAKLSKGLTQQNLMFSLVSHFEIHMQLRRPLLSGFLFRRATEENIQKYRIVLSSFIKFECTFVRSYDLFGKLFAWKDTYKITNLRFLVFIEFLLTTFCCSLKHKNYNFIYTTSILLFSFQYNISI